MTSPVIVCASAAASASAQSAPRNGFIGATSTPAFTAERRNARWKTDDLASSQRGVAAGQKTDDLASSRQRGVAAGGRGHRAPCRRRARPLAHGARGVAETPHATRGALRGDAAVARHCATIFNAACAPPGVQGIRPHTRALRRKPAIETRRQPSPASPRRRVGASAEPGVPELRAAGRPPGPPLSLAAATATN